MAEQSGDGLQNRSRPVQLRFAPLKKEWSVPPRTLKDEAGSRQAKR